MFEGIDSKCFHRSGVRRSAMGLPLVALVMAMAPVTAHAGEAAAAAPGDSDAIVVTATKRSENSMKVPVALSVFTGKTLEATGITDVMSLQVATPGLVFTSTGAYGQPYIRAVGSRLLQDGFDPSVATYVDGRYISRQSAISTDMLDISRVEILKGPQGTLFGRNASGGAIRIITNDVTDRFEGSMQAGYGDYNAREFRGVVNIPLATDLGIRVAAVDSQRDGYAKNLIPTGNPSWNDKDFSAVRSKLRWTPGKLDAKLTFSYWHQKDNDGNDTVALGPLNLDTGTAPVINGGKGGSTGVGPYQVATQVTGENQKREYATELNLKYDLGNMALSSITNYADYNSSLAFDGDGTSAVITDAIVHENDKTFSQELQLSSTNHGRIEWIGGLYYYNDEAIQETTINTGASYISQGRQDVKTISYAAYGQAGWHITDAIKLDVGGRFTHDEKDASIARTTIPGLAAVGVYPSPITASWSKFTPSAALNYTFGNNLVYAKFSRGYKSGGFNYPYPNAPVVSPEQLDMYEIGLKSQLFDHKVLLTLSGYYYDYTNLQISRAATGPNAITVTENAANARLYGIDADANWKVTPRLKLSGSVSLEHTEYVNYTNGDAKEYKGVVNGLGITPGMSDYGFNASGMGMLRAPKFSATATLNYELPVAGGKMPINLNYSYKSSYLFDFIVAPIATGGPNVGTAVDPQTGALRQRAYGLANGRIGFVPDHGSWEVAFWMKNIFNRAYFEDVVASGSGIRASYGAPRTLGGDLTIHF